MGDGLLSHPSQKARWMGYPANFLFADDPEVK